MLSIIKNLSHRLRLTSKTKLISPKRSVVGMPVPYDDVDEDGRVIKKVRFSTDYGPSADLKVSDFALSALLSSGIDPRKEAPLNLSGNGFASADSAIGQIESIDYSQVDKH